MGLAGALALATSCASLPGPSPRGAPACGAELPARALAPGAALLLGEVHGTRELPALFGELVCDAALHGAEVLVGLELPGSERERVERFLASDGGERARAALLEGPFWRRAYQDGRSSEAMAALLERLRQLRAGGLRLAPLLFDAEQPGPDRDRHMAEAIAAGLRARPGAALLALTGNFHARARPGAPWNPAQPWMGAHLRQAGIRVLGFDLAGELAGSAWICTGESASDCGARPWRVRRPLPDGRRRGAALLAEETPEGYAGLWVAESLTASPPAAAP